VAAVVVVAGIIISPQVDQLALPSQMGTLVVPLRPLRVVVALVALEEREATADFLASEV
jgi:hypothetical protein